MTPEQAAVIEAAKEWVDFTKNDGGCTSYAGTQLTIAVDDLKESEAGQDFAWAWEQARAGRKVHHKTWNPGRYLALSADDPDDSCLYIDPTSRYDTEGWRPGPAPAKEGK